MASEGTVKFTLHRLKRLLFWSGAAGVAGLVLTFSQRSNMDLALAGVCLWLPVIVVWFLFGSLATLLALHEAGHFLMGMLVGLEFHSLTIGRLQWAKAGGKVHLREIDQAWSRGWIVMVPAPGPFPRARFAAYLAAGPAANLLAAGGLALVAARNQGLPLITSPASISGFASCAIGLGNLLPVLIQGKPTDGLLIIECLRGEGSMVRGLALSRVTRAAQELVAAEKWNDGDLQLLASDPEDKVYYPAGILYLYYHAMLLNDLDAAEMYIEKVLKRIDQGSPWYAIVRLNAAIFLGYTTRDAVRAEECLSTVSPDAFPGSYAYPMAVAATRLAQCRWTEAAASADEAIRLAQLQTVYPNEHEMLLAMQAEARSHCHQDL